MEEKKRCLIQVDFGRGLSKTIKAIFDELEELGFEYCSPNGNEWKARIETCGTTLENSEFVDDVIEIVKKHNPQLKPESYLKVKEEV